MSDQPAPSSPIPNGQPAPPLQLNIQYTKDLSFEVPGAPEIYLSLREQPRVDLSLDVQARQVPGQQPNVFEVSLQIRADAKIKETSCFIAELVYCGVFTLNVPQEHVEPVLLVECPRLLFPFARNILADVTRDGGFPPVMLNPIDFVALWQSRRGQGQQVGTA
ncbi:protein-export chaperone SecB [Falsiroseomonas bella]|uniref:Protein-export protein SecB n=1 Tax=Falsiroseomonas bella TaxID=2184016 RepID=A0A317FHX3_9PROT|nr:protein-export chaperone SecB [Falsiroseomonas bella]PWS38610.1 protein-export chaperone SecB [Falsiroseomonas bella]